MHHFVDLYLSYEKQLCCRLTMLNIVVYLRDCVESNITLSAVLV